MARHNLLGVFLLRLSLHTRLHHLASLNELVDVGHLIICCVGLPLAQNSHALVLGVRLLRLQVVKNLHPLTLLGLLHFAVFLALHLGLLQPNLFQLDFHSSKGTHFLLFASGGSIFRLLGEILFSEEAASFRNARVPVVRNLLVVAGTSLKLNWLHKVTLGSLRVRRGVALADGALVWKTVSIVHAHGVGSRAASEGRLALLFLVEAGVNFTEANVKSKQRCLGGHQPLRLLNFYAAAAHVEILDLLYDVALALLGTPRQIRWHGVFSFKILRLHCVSLN